MAYLRRRYKTLNNPYMRFKYLELYDELDIRKPFTVFLWPTQFMLRRFLMAYAFVNFQGYYPL